MFMRSVFPESYPGLIPTFLFFDNACGLREHVVTCVDIGLLGRVVLVVDPFHFSGHMETDLMCQTHCNPKKYPMLKDENGAWIFNSSVAEQVNAWFGKFQPKVKEMNVVR